jgi:class 3 adenylate cyclase
MDRPHLKTIEPKIAAHGGRLIRSAGDGLLVEFASAVGAVSGTAELICLRRMRTSDDTSSPRDALH